MIVTPAPPTGFSLSPGGLLYPYHIGALASLEYHKQLSPSSPLAGSSAGAIAVASHAAQVKPETCLDTTVRICDECASLGGARGRLLRMLEAELDSILDDNAHHIVNEREGMVGLAYHEVFPKNRSILQTHFESREELKEAILNSSMFPFFSTNAPFRILNNKNSDKAGIWGSLPRIVVDGYFTAVDRFGCPDFEKAVFPKNINKNKPIIDRTVTISVFPHDSVLMTASAVHDRISPSYDKNNPIGQVSELLRMATQPLTKEEVYKLYESGFQDAERWVNEEKQREQMLRDSHNLFDLAVQDEYN